MVLAGCGMGARDQWFCWCRPVVAGASSLGGGVIRGSQIADVAILIVAEAGFDLGQAGQASKGSGLSHAERGILQEATGPGVLTRRQAEVCPQGPGQPSSGAPLCQEQILVAQLQDPPVAAGAGDGCHLDR